MDNKDLTGIERQLVLQYLIDGNVPVTVTPVEKLYVDDENIKSLSSAVFPVALKAEQIAVSHKGIILLKNPPQSVIGFAGKLVRVEFYFNRVGLFFKTEIRTIKDGLALVIPERIHRIEESDIKYDYNFSVSVYYSCSNKATVNFECIPGKNYELFSRPIWSSIALENQKEAKTYLEMFVSDAKKEKNAGNGLQLIPICRYLTEKKIKLDAFDGRVKPLNILYVDHDRLVLASDNENFPLSCGSEYALKMSFSLKEHAVMRRHVFATCVLSKIYRASSGNRTCADCIYTSLKEEDRRFLYERATKKIFI